MRIGKYLGLNLPDYTDAADIAKLVENFERLEERAPAWTNLSNSGTVLESTGDFQVAPVFPVGDMDVFALTLKMPRAFAEADTITVEGVAYNLYQGTDPALSEAWKAGEVVTINFDKTSRRCWASAGGGAPRPLPAQVSNMQASTPEGETPSIVFTWTNPSDENFAGMILVIKEGSAPNSVTDGTQVYKGTGTTFTYTEGVQWERTYYGRGFAYNSQNKFQLDATGAIASATPSDVPNPVSDLVLTPNKSSATLRWTNPTQQSYSVTKVIQKIDSAPVSPNDGIEVYSGTETNCTISNLQDSIHYYFAVYAIAKNGKYKNAVVRDYIPKVFPDPPTGYNEIEKITSSRTWVAPEDGYFKLIGLAQNGSTGRYGYARGYDDVYYCGGGGGGGAGGITASQFTLKKGQIVEISVTGDISIRCGAEVATATAGKNGSDGKGTGQQGYHGVGGYGGYGGSAQGGNIANITGSAGGTGGTSTGKDASEAIGKVKAGYTATNTYEGYTTGGAYVVVLRGNTNLSLAAQNAEDITELMLQLNQVELNKTDKMVQD